MVWCDVRNNPFSGSCDVSIIHMLWVAASAWLSGTWRGGVETQRGTLINLRANAIRCLLPQWRSAAATYYSILTFFQSSGSSSRIGIHGVGSSSTRRTGNSLDWKKKSVLHWIKEPNTDRLLSSKIETIISNPGLHHLVEKVSKSICLLYFKAISDN